MRALPQLPDELAALIFEWLDPCALARCMTVNKAMATVSASAHIWQKLMRGQCALPPGAECSDWRRAMQKLHSLRAEPSRSIDMALDDTWDSYWSSTGSELSTASEYVILALRPVSIVVGVDVAFYRAVWQERQELYTSELARADLGLVAEGSDPGEESWFCLGDEESVARTTEVQHFKVAALRLSSHARLWMGGKVARQPGDELFYTVVRYVSAQGFDLSDAGMWLGEALLTGMLSEPLFGKTILQRAIMETSLLEGARSCLARISAGTLLPDERSLRPVREILWEILRTAGVFRPAELARALNQS